MLVAPVDAITGVVSPVGKGVEVRLLQLRPEDLAMGSEPGVLGRATTNGKGEFCLELRDGSDVDVCRYMVEVGSSADGTRSRAVVYSTSDPVDIDLYSDATASVILAAIEPDELCRFSPDEIRDIRLAVLDAPGTLTGASVAEVNAVAASLAAADAGVGAALDQAGSRPPPTATDAPGQSTPTSAPATPTTAPAGATHTATVPATHALTPTNTALARTTTPTLVPATPTRPAATATLAAATATSTATAPPATPTIAAATPTFTATPKPAAGLGDRVFTIREDSQFPGQNPRTGFFSSGLGGFSITDKFTAGPLTLTAGAPDANGIAALSLKQDAYFKMNLSPASVVLCVRMRATGSSGRLDCNGGTALGIELVAPSGDAPSPAPTTGRGTDSGPGAAEPTVQQAIAEIASFSATCDASVTFPADAAAVYTTASFSAKKGAAMIVKPGENFDCSAWSQTDGVGMLVTGVVAFDSRAGGNVANVTRIADM